MKNLFRRLFGRKQSVRSEHRGRRRDVRANRIRLEELEGRMLLNSHPVGAVPEHIHPHLAIFVDGENFTIPANVGVTLGEQTLVPNENAHTHTDDGIIHYNESTAVFRNLDEFFDTWGAVFNQNQLRLPTAYDSNGQPTTFSEWTVDSTHTIRFFVNGAASSDFELYEPEDGDQILISYETIATSRPRAAKTSPM